MLQINGDKKNSDEETALYSIQVDLLLLGLSFFQNKLVLFFHLLYPMFTPDAERMYIMWPPSEY